MQFVKDGEILTVKEAECEYPSLKDIVNDPQYEKVKIIQDQNYLKLAFDNLKPIYIDIDAEVKRHNQHFFKNSPYNELLARAIGLKKDKEKPQVCDATGGLLSDSIMFIALGIKSLTVYERNPILSLLINNAKQRSSYAFTFNPNSELSHQNFDVIYFDPMYSDKNLKSAPKKEMMILRDIVGVDEDSLQKAQSYLELAKVRLVIKRPIKAPPLLAGFSHQISGKSTRYDVYMKV